jgi:hypothetical protein
MAFGQYIKSPFVLTNGYTIKTDDSSLNPNSVFLYDAGYTRSWAKQTDPSNNDVIKNMVVGGPDSKVVKGAGNMTFEDGGFHLYGVEGTHIEVGGGSDFKFTTMGNPDIMVWAWYKRLTDTSYGGYPAIIGRGAKTTAERDFHINLGSDGRSVIAAFADTSGVPTQVALANGQPVNDYRALYGQTVQIGMAMEGGKIKLFINGVLFGTQPDTFAKPYNNLTNFPIRIGAGIGGTELQGIVKRWGMTKISGAYTAQAIISRDYADNHERLNPVV